MYECIQLYINCMLNCFIQDSINRVQCRGQTGLYDAIVSAVRELMQVKKQHPDCIW